MIGSEDLLEDIQKIDETLICPDCGSKNIALKCKDPLDLEGIICLDCGSIFPGSQEAIDKLCERRPRIYIKAWRKAWYES